MGAGVVLIDQSPEPFSEFEACRVLTDCGLEAGVKILFDRLCCGSLVVGETKRELFEVDLAEIEERVGVAAGTDDVFLGSDRAVEQFRYRVHDVCDVGRIVCGLELLCERADYCNSPRVGAGLWVGEECFEGVANAASKPDVSSTRVLVDEQRFGR
jgi:hypothetical protein